MKCTIVLLFAILGLAVQIKGDLSLCSTDDDCAYLGGLKCIKSFCSTGVCSCPRNTVSKWIGNDRKFQCVPIRRVGEPCSTTGETGVCGAPLSECDQTTELCKCTGTNIPIWSGERCVASYETTQGETCGTGIDATCGLAKTNGPVNNCRGPSNYATATTRSAPMSLAITTCTCQDSEKLVISNEYYNSLNGARANYVHLKEPLCVNRVWGDSCQEDNDCPGTLMVCTSNKCACSDSTHTYDYDKTSCGAAIAAGGTCSTGNPVSPSAAGAVCDGALGLMCGDLCLVTGDNKFQSVNATCVCGPMHTGTTSCTAIEVGSECVGDQQCKWSDPANLCEITDRSTSSVKGKCVAGANAIVASFITLALPLIIILKN